MIFIYHDCLGDLTRPFQSDPDVPATLIGGRLGAADFADGGYPGVKGPARRAENARDDEAADRAWTWTNDVLAATPPQDQGPR